MGLQGRCSVRDVALRLPAKDRGSLSLTIMRERPAPLGDLIQLTRDAAAGAALVRPLRHRHRCSRAERALAASTLPDRQRSSRIPRTVVCGSVSDLPAEYSQRRACRLLGMAPKTFRYRSGRPEDTDLRQKLRELASQRCRFGYGRLLILALPLDGQVTAFPGAGRQTIFASISRSVAGSSICSGSSFLSLRFSSPSAFRRFASETSRLPYFERHV